MLLYVVEVRGESRERFELYADTPDQAEQFWWQGGGKPVGTEITDVEVYDVRKVEQ